MPVLFPPQQLVDRIVARIEDDIITLSELRELGQYQELVNGKVDPDDRLLRELIEQWIVNNEATAAHFARPAQEAVDRELASLEKGSASPEAFRARLAQVGLAEAELRRLVERQIYLSRYLDYKFRPAAQVDSAAVEKYYREEFSPPLEAKGQTPPPLRAVHEQIRELLVQRAISQRAEQWLDESRAHLKVEIVTPGSGL